jgi:hypothetical protein
MEFHPPANPNGRESCVEVPTFADRQGENEAMGWATSVAVVKKRPTRRENRTEYSIRIKIQ